MMPRTSGHTRKNRGLTGLLSAEFHRRIRLQQAEEFLPDGNGETETVTLTDSEPITDQTKRFLRIRIERDAVL